MGNNADRLYVLLKYTPIAKFKVNAWLQYIRKGAAGTVDQQYQQPQPDFLFGKLFSQKDIGLQAQYEWTQSFKTYFKINHFDREYTNSSSLVGNLISIGISYGL